MIKAKHLEVRYAHENMVREQHPIHLGAVVQPNWTERTYMVYLTGTTRRVGSFRATR